MNNEQMVGTADGALINLDNARREIESANDLLSLKNIHDKLVAMRVYCKAAKVSFEITQRCSELKIRCERRAGELLNSREKHPPGPLPEVRSHDATYPPRLEELEITKSQSSRWQSIAKIPETNFEERLEDIKNKKQELTSRDLLSLAGYLNREKKREKRRESASEEAKNVEFDDRIQIRHGDFQEVLKDIPDNSVQLILTDPIYAKENLSDWSDLSLFASRVLKQGKVLACYCSTNILAESIKRLSEHLQYVWTFAVTYPACRMTHYPFRIHEFWKPVLLFSKGKYEPDHWIDDVIKGGGLIKEFHQWEQPVAEALYLIDNLSYPNDLIVDCFLGSGTVAIAAKKLNRRFIGSDKDINAVNTARSRLGMVEI
jgi:site-specific DNA-methyltransferase (adenine-specific)